jgi:hypothetical protein
MILNQEVEMENERIHQQMQENPIMIEEDVNPSHVFMLMLMNLILLWWL